MIKRVTRSHPCPVCGKPDWCGYTDTIAICMRVPSDRPSKNGGWVHRLTDDNWQGAEYNPGPKPTKRADIFTLDRAYRIMAAHEDLKLSRAHREHLWKRGLEDGAIDYFSFRTLGEKRIRAAKAVCDAVGETTLAAIPGFMWKEGEYGPYPTIAGAKGILIPAWDLYGRIQGWQIRRDNLPPDNERRKKKVAKYTWLSSAFEPGGASSGAPIHLARPPVDENEDVLYVTEGLLKANVTAYFLKSKVIGVPGVSNWAEVPDYVAELKPRVVVIAYDADLLYNPAVARNLAALANTLKSLNWKVAIAQWSPKYGKGIDDVLANGERRKIIIRPF